MSKILSFSITLLGTMVLASAQNRPASPPDVTGVYQPIAANVTLPGGLKNSGSPNDVPLLPAAREQLKNVNLKDDPWNACQPIGQFRLMARETTKIELLPAGNMIAMLFEDLSHGVMRGIYTNREHRKDLEPNWFGDSVGRWEGNTLVVDTVGFNTKTWLSDAGAQHSEALHLVERIRPILGGKYLEYKMTAEDPKVLAKPYTYTRYYQKLNTEIMEDVCQEDEVYSISR